MQKFSRSIFSVKRIVVGSLALIGTFSPPSGASADEVTGATYSGSIFVGGTPPPGTSCCTGTTTAITAPGTVSDSYTNYAGSTSTSTLTVNAAVPSITANVSAGGVVGVSEANALET